MYSSLTWIKRILASKASTWLQGHHGLIWPEWGQFWTNSQTLNVHYSWKSLFFFTILLCCCCILIKRNCAFTQHRILTVAHRGSICTTVKIKSSIMTHCSEGKKIHTTCQSYNQCSPQKTLVSTLFLGLTIVHLRQLIWGLNAFGKHLPESPVP